MAEWIPETRPDWWDDIKNFAQNPVGAILGIALTFVVEGILNISEVVLDALTLIAWGDETSLGLVDIPRFIAGLLVSSLTAPVGAVFEAIRSVNMTIGATVEASTGIGAPVVATALWLGWLYVLYRAGRLTLTLISPRLAALNPLRWVS